ncbi:MAG: aldolase [Anaerolineales bacterium]|nr:aldolase [Anaerolineales bacterium]
MTLTKTLTKVSQILNGGIQLTDGHQVGIKDQRSLQENIEGLVKLAIFGEDEERAVARWLVRECALAVGIYPASIHNFYHARGLRKMRDDFTVPALNLRVLPFHAGRAVFRICDDLDARAIIFEIARSEIGYTNQAPSEYASSILGAAIAEGYQGPIFIQGDHFQIGAKRFQDNPELELETVRNLSEASVQAGFFNIDIDTSTLVDLSKATITEQQEINYRLSAELAAYIRGIEPEGVTVSLGGEIGEVGGQNSTEPELRAYMEGFETEFAELIPDKPGLSKISIQTGTSHGGVVLPDGTIAEASVDFDTLYELSAVAKEYEMGGTVQHGASTLPLEAFSKFAEANALEVHLATGFMNIAYDRIPIDLRNDMYAYLEQAHIDERKPEQTDEQFYYKTRKKALGPYKKLLWEIPIENRKEIEAAWEEQFRLLFTNLNIAGTADEVSRFIQPVPVHEPISSYAGEALPEKDTSDLAD